MASTIRKQWVLASGNPGKLAEMQAMFADLAIDLRPQSDWQTPEAEEPAVTFVENALLKARHAAAHCGCPALADDSGLVVPALDGAPGVRSARYAGSGADAAANNRKLLKAMTSIEQRSACFVSVMVWCRDPDDPMPVIAEGRWWGEILTAPRGDGGFGYDPLFRVPEHDCAAAELPSEVKNRISHRGLAAAQLRRRLTALAGQHDLPAD